MDRRTLLKGLFVAPAIVKATSLMPVKGIIMDTEPLLVQCSERPTYGYIDRRVVFMITGWNQYGERVTETVYL